ncbi:MAG: hypothetical protein ACTHY7_05485 [Marinobacter sp.]
MFGIRGLNTQLLRVREANWQQVCCDLAGHLALLLLSFLMDQDKPLP